MSRVAHEDSSWAHFVLKVIGLRCQKKSDVSHISLPSSALSGTPPSPCFTQPPTPQRREKGRLIDVEGCSGPTAINSSPPRSSLSCWWNLCTTAARHGIQEGLQTNASSVFALLFCLQSGPLWQTLAETTSASVPSFLQWLAALEYGVRRIEEVKRLEGSWSYKGAEQLFSPSLTSRWRPGVTCWDTVKPVPVERLQSDWLNLGVIIIDALDVTRFVRSYIYRQTWV